MLASDFPHGPYPNETDYTLDDIKIHPYNNRVTPEKPGYYQNIKYDDIQLGEILNMIDRNGLKNNTMLFTLQIMEFQESLHYIKRDLKFLL